MTELEREVERRKFMSQQGRYLGHGCDTVTDPRPYVVLYDDMWYSPYSGKGWDRVYYDGTPEGAEQAERDAIDAGIAEAKALT